MFVRSRNVPSSRSTAERGQWKHREGLLEERNRVLGVGVLGFGGVSYKERMP